MMSSPEMYIHLIREERLLPLDSCIQFDEVDLNIFNPAVVEWQKGSIFRLGRSNTGWPDDVAMKFSNVGWHYHNLVESLNLQEEWGVSYFPTATGEQMMRIANSDPSFRLWSMLVIEGWRKPLDPQAERAFFDLDPRPDILNTYNTVARRIMVEHRFFDRVLQGELELEEALRQFSENIRQKLAEG